MSVVEEGGKVATNVVAALTGTPTLLVIVILNIAMIVASAWYLHEQGNYNSKINQLIVERCFPTNGGSSATQIGNIQQDSGSQYQG